MKPYYCDPHSGITIYHARAEDVLPTLEPGSVDLVLTDPPYLAEFDWLYAVIAEHAAKLLKPGASLVTLCGHYQIPKVLASMEPHLRYWWIGGMKHNTQVRLFGKHVVTTWKPALWFVKGGRRTGDTNCPIDLLAGGGQDKRYHHWGQSVSWFAHWATRLCPPGGVILDPCMGAGTTLRAAKDTGRQAIGIEVEEKYCQIAAERMAQEVMTVEATPSPEMML